MTTYGGRVPAEPLWRGVGVALLTFFDDTGRVDADATGKHANRLAELGVRGLLVAGSTGEADALDEDERVAVLAAVRTAVPDLPVIAGTGGPYAGVVVRRSRRAFDTGADAVLVPPPRACRDVAAFYAELSRALPGPVIGYHFPAVLGGPGVPADELSMLPLAGVKDSSGDAERLLVQLTSWDGPVWTGSSALVLTAGALGAAGAILAAANVDPETCADAWAGDPEAQHRLLPTHLGARYDFPSGLKAMTAARFGTPTGARLG